MNRTVAAEPGNRAVIGAAVAATIFTVYPGFLIGALAVQVSDEFDVSEGSYGWALAGFFVAATAGSMLLGRLAQLIGPRRQVTIALLVSAVAQLGIALFTSSFGVVIGGLAVCGLANAGNQTGINLLLTRAKLPRLGLALAIKQSGMPASSVLSGLAVPLIALTVGWRWAYVLGAIGAVVAMLNVRRVTTPIGRMERGERAVPSSSRRSLTIASVSVLLMAFAAGALGSWLVSSAVESGMDKGAAGLTLSLGSASGIAMRLFFGFRLDASERAPFRSAGALSLLGAAGVVLLSTGVPSLHLVATVIAFGAGWVWPIFTNFGVVRSNLGAAGTATGVTQTGVYVGVALAPLVTGWIIEAAGYATMWLVVAATLAAGALLAFVVADDF